MFLFWMFPPWFLGYQQNLPSFVCKLYFKVFLYFTDHNLPSICQTNLRILFNFLNFSLLINKMMTKSLVNYLWISLIKNELAWTNFEMQDRIWWNVYNNQWVNWVLNTMCTYYTELSGLHVFICKYFAVIHKEDAGEMGVHGD